MKNTRIELHDTMGTLVEKADVETEKAKTVHSIVHKGKHYAYANMGFGAITSLQFREVTPPIELSDLL